MWITDRRNQHQRARIVQTMVNLLRLNEVCTLQLLARAAGGVPEPVVSRVVKRFALRGLVRNVAAGVWSATPALRMELYLVECAAPA
jgi:hypothetical protein